MTTALKTLAHIEPYPTPNIIDQDLGEILNTVGFVDSIYFGGWNYNPEVRRYPRYLEFYRGQSEIVRRFREEGGNTMNLPQPPTAISTLGRMVAAVARAACTGWARKFRQSVSSSPRPSAHRGSACCVRR